MSISEDHPIGIPCRGNLKFHKKKKYQSTSMDGTPEVVYRRSFRLQSLRLFKIENPFFWYISVTLKNQLSNEESFSLGYWPLKMKWEHGLETSVNKHPAKRRSSPEERKAQMHGFASWKLAKKKKVRVFKDLRGYCRGQITLRFFLEFACGGEGHGEPTFRVIWGWWWGRRRGGGVRRRNSVCRWKATG